MKNEIGRKITSLTLMTIMLAGGITVGAQGFTPEAYADHNANLFVSAEKTGNSFDGLQIVEVVIIDEDLTGTPDVTINGDTLTMTEATDGNHYAYFADSAVSGYTNDGLNFGTVCSTDPNPEDAATHCDVHDTVVDSAKPAFGETATSNTWPYIQLFAFSGTAEIEYNRAGGAERTVLDFDDNSEGMTLDRATYPPGAEIHAIINDHRLNIDPTSADAWTWNANGGDMYYRLNDDVDTANPIASGEDLNGAKVVSDAVCEGCSITITPNGVIEADSAANRPLATTDVVNADGTTLTDLAATDNIDYSEAIWVSIREISGPNTGMFATTDLDDDSTIQTTSGAQRDTAGVLDYDGTSNSIVIKHYTAEISIDAPTDAWTSGSAIPITVVDDDANKNSLSDETISVTDADSIIPTLITGNPLTMGNSDTRTWVGYIVFSDDGAGSPYINSERAYDAAKTLYELTIDSADQAADIATFEPPSNPIDFKFADDGSIIDNEDANDIEFNGDLRLRFFTHPALGKGVLIGFQNSADVESFSDRGILEFTGTFTDSRINANLTAMGVLNTDVATDDVNYKNSILSGFPLLVIDLDHTALRDVLINNASDDEHGFNMVNFNVDSLGDGVSVDKVDIRVNRAPTGAQIDVTGSNGYVQIPDNSLTNVFGDSGLEGHIQVILQFDPTARPSLDSDTKYPVVLDFMSFGFKNSGEASSERIANQIIRLELEESSDSQGAFEGTLEYVMVNQLNILDSDTYTGISPISDEVSFVVIEDLTGSDAPTVTYLDVGADGVATQVSAQEDAPSHSGVVSLDVETFKVADTVTVTLEDLDLNVQSELIDIYTVVKFTNEDFENNCVLKNETPLGCPNVDAVGDKIPEYGGTSIELGDGSQLGRLLDVTFDDQRWQRSTIDACVDALDGHNGLGATGFSLVETTVDSGVFTGSFQIPAEVCLAGESDPVSSTGLDIAVNYVDFRDASGETTEVSSDAGVKANTGSVSFDRTVYPVPFGSEGESKFAHGGGVLSNGDLIVYVSVNDPDFDVSASGEDSIALDEEPVTVTVSRGSTSYEVEKAGGVDSPITEIAPDAGIFEAAIEISYNEGPSDSNCPEAPPGDDKVDDNGNTFCILQGDILQVEYDDPTDASGESNTVTDSATFDLRNGVLQSDKSVYIIGSDMILTLIEPDFDLDSSQNETYDLDLIEWDSSAATVTMGRDGGESGAFDPEPFSLRETGPNTGIFQVVIEIPAELEGDSLERGEEIELIYVDWGPSGSEYVGDNDEEISLTVFTSNFGASVEMDQKIYTWTDKVYITIVAPDHNFDSQLIDEIGEEGAEDELRIGTRENSLDGYRLVETGADTGIFTGEVILTGFTHDPIGYDPGNDRRASGSGPTDGYLETEQDGGISVSYEFSGDETVLTSSLIRWNIGEVQWLEASYPASGNGILRIIDPDMSLNPEAVDNFDIKIASSSDASGIRLTVTETNEATGIFEGTVFFTTTSASSGHRLRIAEGDTVTAIYDDATLPDPYTTADSISITATTLIGTIVPPLERAPASDLRVVDPFGNSLSTVSPDQQVQVSANLANGQDRDQDFAYLVQIQNSDGVTVALAWIAGSLSPGQSFSPAVSWIPTEAGTYTVTAFVWESVDNPTALSPPVTIDVSVN